MRELRPGLWHWTAPHPDWSANEPYGVTAEQAGDGSPDLLVELVLPTHDAPTDRAALGRALTDDPTPEGGNDGMTEVLLFHHAQGQTEGFKAFADELRGDGHTVHTPDLFEGRTFGSIEEGMGFVEELGFGEIIERGDRAAADLPAGLVYGGFSLGVVPAQKLAQTRPGARGALFFYSCVPVSEFGTWPEGVPAQIHGMDRDPYFMEEGDVDAARELVDATDRAELFLYPGDQHYFADSSLPSYDADATALLTERVRAFLRDVDKTG